MLAIRRIRAATQRIRKPSRKAKLAGAGYALLIVAWLGASGPFTAPDEDLHFIRAIGVGQGELIGVAGEYFDPDFSPTQTAWANENARMVSIPPGLSPEGVLCQKGRRFEAIDCLDKIDPPLESTNLATAVGTYPPWPYLVPGWAVIGSHAALDTGLFTSFYVGRTGAALTAIGLIWAALWFLDQGDSDGYWLMAPLMVFTPMLVYISSALNSSGVEIASGLAFMTGLLRWADQGELSRSEWFILATSAGVLCVTRSTGPLWAALIITSIAAFTERGRLMTMLKNSGKAPAILSATLAVSTLINRLWDSNLAPSLSVEFQQPSALGLQSFVVTMTDQVVGVFGYLDVGFPPIIYQIALLAAALLLGAGWLEGTKPQRRGILVAVVAAVVIPYVLELAVQHQTGFGIQGRHIMPFVLLLPLMATKTITSSLRARFATDSTRIATIAGIMVVALHIYALIKNAHRQANGLANPIDLFTQPEWAPPGGFLIWIALAGVGASLILTAASHRPKARV